MLQQVIRAFNLERKLLLVTMAVGWNLLALELPRHHVSPETPQLQFEWASINPDPSLAYASASMPMLCQGVDGRLGRSSSLVTKAPTGHCLGRFVSLFTLIQTAYGVRQPNVSAGPDWTGWPVTFQIEARAKNPEVTTTQQLQQMLQKLLADRFKLKIRRERRESQGYELAVAENGLKLRSSSDPEETLNRRTEGSAGSGGRTSDALEGPQTVSITGNASLKVFAAYLGNCGLADRAVVDKTRLSGIYNFNLTLNQLPLSPAVHEEEMLRSLCSPRFDPPLAKALENQAGLRLEPQEIQEDFIVIEHAEMMSDK